MLRRLRGRVRQLATGTGMLALAVPLAWPSGVGGQHLDGPPASKVHSGVVRLADWVTDNTAPAPTTPVQQAGTAAGGKSLVPVSQTRGLKHVTGHAAGKGEGQLDPWSGAHTPASASGTFTSPGTTGKFMSGAPARGFDPTTSTPVAAGTTAQSDLYQNADGSYTRKVWSSPVNYQTSSGSWAPIDATLMLGSSGRWQEKANSLGVSFAAAGSDKTLASVAIPGGTQQVAFSLDGAGNVAAAASGTSVTYPGVLPDTDVTETATAGGLSEALTLASAAAGTSWVFPLTLTGLTASLSGGTVNLTDAAGDVVADIPPAVARSGPVNPADPHSQASSTLTYQLVTENGAPALKMTLDSSWLGAAGRAFPVTVDPTVNTDPQGSDYAESDNGSPENANNSGATLLPSGTATFSGVTYDDIDFLDYSSLGTSYANDHITAAALKVFDSYAYQCTASTSVTAYQVTGSWSPSTAMTYPGPAYGTQDAQWTGTAPTDACNNGSGLLGKGGWLALTMNSSGISLLNQWTANSASNFGFAVLTSLSDQTAGKEFDSYADNSVAGSQGGDCTGDCRPYLQLTYTATAADVAPQVNSTYPPSNYSAPTLTPELLANGSDSDNYPNTSLQYDFTVYTASGTQVVTSGNVATDDWTVPAGSLSWGQQYYWTAKAYDGDLYSANSQYSYFTTAVPQPLVTSGLSQNPDGPGFNAQTGNWTTTATDAQVSTVGPELDITRDYNSTNPRNSGAFGAGWSSVLDMKVSAGEDGANGNPMSQIVTYPDGEDVEFGLNSDGTTYSPPPGRFATLATVSGGGFTLTDKNDTVYKFTQVVSSGVYGISSITDALGHTETFTYNGSQQVTTITAASGRALTVSWATPSGASYAHVASVVTPDATAGNAATAQTWTYNYSGDQLAAACPPASTTACTTYAYTAGSDYPNAVLDSDPHSYWRLDDASGTANAADSVLANEGASNAPYTSVTLGQDTGPLTGSAAKAATFNGTSSYATLPQNLVTAAQDQTISLWFKTTAVNGVLWSSSASGPAGSTAGIYTPELYIGSDGKLVGAFWDGNASDVITSASALNNGQWHNAVLADYGSGQTLYVDGQKVGSLAKGFASTAQANDYIGAGFLGGGWPDEPHYNNTGNNTGYAYVFSGDISDAALWTRQLSTAEVQTLYTAGTHSSALLTKITRPNNPNVPNDVYAQVTYDPLTGRVTQDTDSNGGTWNLSAPTAKGSSQVYVASVLGAHPDDYWRLNDSAGSSAADLVSNHTAASALALQSATYNSVTENAAGGPFADANVASFNGYSSYIAMPTTATTTTGPGTLGLWFKTTGTGQVLYSESNTTVLGNAASAYDPVLYVGADGKLNGELWDGSYNVATSTAAVNDGKWHYAVLAAGTSSQSLYVDGQLQATISGTLQAQTQAYSSVTAGAGWISGSWPDSGVSSETVTGLGGNLAEMAWYPSQLTSAQVSAQWNAAQESTGLSPVQTSTLTDPGSHTLSYTYDLLNGGRELSETDANGAVTTFGYDSNGFQDDVDVAGTVDTATGYDPRGNMVSKTTCQDQQTGQCSTAYWTYYPNDTSATLTPDPRNDQMLTDADGRSASASDTTYQTQYAYNSSGEVTGVTSPPVTGYPSGRTTTYAYTDGSTTTGGYSGAVPPKGLPYQETTPGGAVTTTLYYANGDVAQVTDPDGQRTGYVYDGLGREASETAYSSAYPSGLITTYTYNTNGDVATETDPGVPNRVTGAVHTAQTTSNYDPDGDLTSQVVADTTGLDTSRTDTRTYNNYDQLTSETDPAGGKSTYTYDGYGNLASETDPDGNTTQYTYDGDGNLLTTALANYTGSPPKSQTAATLTEESRTYDLAGRLAEVDDAMGRETHYYYTDNGLLAGVIESTLNWTQSFTSEWYSYDGAGNLNEEWTNNGDTDTTYAVDPAGRLTQETVDPSGLDRTTAVTYTPDDLRASVTQSGPDGVSQATSYTYDPAGNELSQTVTDPGSGAPAAWYKLTQSSGTAVPDGVSGGQPATASGVTWSGTAGTFSGTSGSAISTNGPVLDTTGSFTVAGWVNLAAAGTGSTQVLASQAAGTASGFTLGYDSASKDWMFARALTDVASPTVTSVKSTTAASTGTWTFLAGTYNANSGTMTLYVNGTAAGTATDTTPIPAHGAFTIGSAKSGGAQGSWLNGQAHDVQAYPRALSAAQLSALSSAGGDSTTSTLTTSWTRDQRGLPTTMTTPDGQVTTYNYDEAGNLSLSTAPSIVAEGYGTAAMLAHPATMTGYDTFGDAAETDDPNGNVTNYTYDADGRQVQKTLTPYTPPGGTKITPFTKMSYDGDGLVLSTTDGLNNTTTYAYDQLGDQVTATAPDSSVTTTAYDADGEPLTVTGPTGAQTQSTWDYLGRPLTTTQVERYSGSGTAAYTTSYAYGDAGGPGGGGGWLSQQTSPDGVTAKYAYDAAGETTAVTDGAANTTAYAYDSLGRQTKTTYPDGTATKAGYDGVGDPTSATQLDASGNTLTTTSATYDGEGDQLSATDALGNSNTFTYDPTGMVTQEVQPVSATSGITTSFGYDADGNQTRYTDGNGNQWWDNYNSWDLQESRIEPYTATYTTPANSTFTTAYDADQNPVTETEPGGVAVTDTYNKVDELTGQSGTGADATTPTRTFGYDSAGDLTSAATSNTLGTGSNATSESFTYNDRGEVLTASGTAGSTSYGYNGDGLTTSEADAAGTTSYTYDNDDRLSTLANPATGTTGTYSYNSDSLVTGISYGSGKDTQSYGYDSLHRITSDTLKTSSGTTVASLGYGYNADSEVTSETSSGLAGTASNTYTYDQADRLTSWNNGTTATNYGYDANGNLTTFGSKTYTYDARDELTGNGTNTFSYTARGTPSSEPGPTANLATTFDAYGDQMTAGTRAYAYDGLGRLTSDLLSGSGYAFSYVGSSETMASDGSSAYAWDPSGSTLVGTGSPGGGTSGVLSMTDVHGNQAGQFTAAGTSMSGSKAYDPWGTVTATTGAFAGLLGYQSAWTDASAGKSLMGARWYDPSAGDFFSADTMQVSPDPDPAAGNPFAYAADEPMDLTDPSGHCIAGFGSLCSLGDKVVSTAKKVVSAVKKVVSSAVDDSASYSVREVEALRASAARVTRDVTTKVKDVVKPVVHVVVRAVVQTEKRVVTRIVSTAKSVAKHVTSAAKTVAKTVTKAAKAVAKGVTKAAKVVAKGVTTAVKAVARASVSVAKTVAKASTSVASAAWSHRRGLMQIGMVAAAVGLTVLNVAQLGLDPATDAAEAVDIGALASEGAEEGASIAAEAGSEGAEEGASEAAESSADEVGEGDPGEGDDDTCPVSSSAPGVGGNSFAAGTLVVLASGKAIAISHLKVGDKVLASDTKTGKDQPETVTAVLVHHDTNLYNLKVKTSHGIEVIHTTSKHLFWAPSLDKGWITAKHLKLGTHLRTPDGQTAVVVGGSVPTVHDGWMWDLTVPGNNDHDFYVIPAQPNGSHETYPAVVGTTPVLAHNESCEDGGSTWTPDENYSPEAIQARSAQWQEVVDDANGRAAQKAVFRGQGPRQIGRIDAPEESVPGSQWHAQGPGKGSPGINMDGTYHDGDPNWPNQVIQWLADNGWQIGEGGE